jgi:hypothetical protein
VGHDRCKALSLWMSAIECKDVPQCARRAIMASVVALDFGGDFSQQFLVLLSDEELDRFNILVAI